jgi:hypothetical protein
MESKSKEKDPKKGHLGDDGVDEEQPEHSVHVKKLHHGYHVKKKYRDGSESEHATDDVDGAMDHVMDHLQQDGQVPNAMPMSEQGNISGQLPPSPQQGVE